MIRQTIFIVYVLCAIAVSHQAVLEKLKSPKNLVKQSFTEIGKDITDVKNEIKGKLGDVSPHVLGPIADALDPDWLSGMNYTRWIYDLDEAVKDGNTEKWVRIVSQRFEVDRVVEEVKTSTASKASCLACKFLVNLGRHMLESGKSEKDVLDVASTMCSTLKIQTARVCRGIMDLIGIDVVEVIKDSPMTSAQICSFVLQDACLNGYDERHQWTVAISQEEKHVEHLRTPPPDDLPKLKVLQISDTHYDPYYEEGMSAVCDEPLCCRAKDGLATSKEAAAGKWGDYRKCDTPQILFENALQHISETHKDIDYIIWTGDLPPHDVWNQTREENLKNLRFSANLMAKYFKDIPIYPSVGNHESCPVDSFAPEGAPPRKNMSWLYDALNEEWSRWLPSETSETIRRTASYSIRVKPGFRIISINGNYCTKNNFWLLKNSTDPMGLLAWLVRELEAAESNKEKVHIIGHIPPGVPDCLKVWSRNYYDIINRFESIIMAQFFGHTHYDEFEIFYDSETLTRPLSIGYISPSITPWENVNPAYRIYYVDGDHSQTTRAIIDHETWKMNIDEANQNDNPVWYKAYNAKRAYKMTSLLPKHWDELVNKMMKDDNLFETYHRNMYRNSPVRPQCDKNCKRNIICALRSGRSNDKELCKYIE